MAETPHHALKRLLVNGPLTGLPRRPADQDLLAAMAAARFEPGRQYRETEVNGILESWLGTFCEPYGIDHVTMRRMLVDARLLAREASGATYRRNPAKRPTDEEAAAEPAAVLAEIQAEREARKARAGR